MLSDEEKKAIFYLKDLENDKEHLTIEQRQSITTILNLIKKQSKEIQLLKEQKQYVIDEYGETIEKQSKEIEELKQEKEYLNCIIESDKDNYINKDKIREKIDYLLDRYDSEEDFCSYDVIISILQSLLKEE